MQLAVYDLLGALFAPSDPLPVSRHADRLFARIRGVIKEGFADPDFGPVEVAAETGISLRYLQKLFTARGSTCSEFIYSLRLDHAAHLAASPGVAGNKPAAQRDRLCLRLSRLHPFRAQISPSVRLSARRSRRQLNSACRYRKKGVTGTRRPALGGLNPRRKIAPGNQDGSSQRLASGGRGEPAHGRGVPPQQEDQEATNDYPFFAARHGRTSRQTPASQIRSGAQTCSSSRRPGEATHTRVAQRAR